MRMSNKLVFYGAGAELICFELQMMSMVHFSILYVRLEGNEIEKDDAGEMLQS